MEGTFTTPDISVEWAVKIPMRDGIQLNATVYKPAQARGASPYVLLVTPYVSNSYHAEGMYFATHGLPFVIVDARGRGNSEGTFSPYLQEAQDGYDAVEWLANCSDCDGQVALWGGSY